MSSLITPMIGVGTMIIGIIIGLSGKEENDNVFVIIMVLCVLELLLIGFYGGTKIIN